MTTHLRHFVPLDTLEKHRLTLITDLSMMTHETDAQIMANCLAFEAHLQTVTMDAQEFLQKYMGKIEEIRAIWTQDCARRSRENYMQKWQIVAHAHRDWLCAFLQRPPQMHPEQLKRLHHALMFLQMTPDTAEGNVHAVTKFSPEIVASCDRFIQALRDALRERRMTRSGHAYSTPALKNAHRTNDDARVDNDPDAWWLREVSAQTLSLL